MTGEGPDVPIIGIAPPTIGAPILVPAPALGVDSGAPENCDNYFILLCNANSESFE